MPEYDVYERHTLAVDASPEEVMRATRALRPRDVPLMTGLMTLRGIPELVLRRRLLLNLREPVIDQFLGHGFMLLADERDEIVLGAVGRFWTSDGSFRRVARGEFAEFAEPGYAKGAMAIRADGTAVVTETRVHATDDEARRVFGRYWRVIKLGSGAIRLEFLRAIKRRAERGA